MSEREGECGDICVQGGRVAFPSDTQLGVGVTNVLKESIVLLTDEGLFMVTGNIVPVDTVVIELIEEGQAVLGGSILLEFTVVGLGNIDASAGRPIALVTFVGGG